MCDQLAIRALLDNHASFDQNHDDRPLFPTPYRGQGVLHKLLGLGIES